MKLIEKAINFLEHPIVWKIWALIIVLLSLLPSQAIKPFSITDIVGIDKLGHFIFYAILVFLYLLSAKQKRQAYLSEKNTIILLFIVALYSFIIELTQSSSFLGRNFDNLDLIANIAGSICGVLIYKTFINKIKQTNYA